MLSFGVYWAEELWCEYTAVCVIISKSISTVFYKERKRYSLLLNVLTAWLCYILWECWHCPTSLTISCALLLTSPKCAVALNAVSRGKWGLRALCSGNYLDCHVEMLLLDLIKLHLCFGEFALSVVSAEAMTKEIGIVVPVLAECATLPHSINISLKTYNTFLASGTERWNITV